ncbi:MAG: DUF1926 domain-containing protein [Chitinivibrionales bacterium]|nr:DUF1926 domain-containing protein [Chitinivibrionales bacterium]MBD3356551.1 DUF1926 domain-containing protein [Chitinivibrionales bacterium]
MKRHGLALLVHPYKNVLLPRDRLREVLDRFARKLVGLLAGHQNLRLGLVLPAYMLQLIDPLLLAQLRDISKRGDLEWLLPGYTEPFVSFSPQWLTAANVRAGMELFDELAGVRPDGFVPAFSNWEPSCVDIMAECGLQYAVLSQVLFPRSHRDCCGYWVTECGGTSTVVLAAHVMHHFTAPPNLAEWLTSVVERDAAGCSASLVVIDYLVPLVENEEHNPFSWLDRVALGIETILLKFQLALLNEVPASSPPAGLQYIPPSLAFKREENEPVPGFQNFLHTFDQVGIMQRKMTALAWQVAEGGAGKKTESLKRELFFIQDINRYLPHAVGGFPDIRDRLWTYGRMIALEARLAKREHLKGGQIRIADFLRNGTKCIVLSNSALKAYIDHKNGGQVFELDFRAAHANVFAAYNPKQHEPPRILVPGKSRLSFVDHFLAHEGEVVGLLTGEGDERGDFVRGPYDYKLKKSPDSVKAVLRRQGALLIEEKQYPLVVEKAFGLRESVPEFSFAYQLLNQSLAGYSFVFAVEFTFALPGVPGDRAHLKCGRTKHRHLRHNRVLLEGVTEWSLHDMVLGVAISFVTQKPVGVWCVEAGDPSGKKAGNYMGTTLVVYSPVSLGENAAWSLVGKLEMKKLRVSREIIDAI